MLDTEKWSGEGSFTQIVLGALEQIAGVTYIRVEDAPASRSEADYNFISNEIYVRFATEERREPFRRFGVLPSTRVVHAKVMTVGELEQLLTNAPEVGAPDYSDQGMLQYLRTERIIPPYQTRGYKLVELVRLYEIDAPLMK